MLIDCFSQRRDGVRVSIIVVPLLEKPAIRTDSQKNDSRFGDNESVFVIPSLGFSVWNYIRLYRRIRCTVIGYAKG
jgi:hypothetical protein